MYDLERINVVIEDINTYLKKLENRKIKTVSDLDEVNFYACSMLLFSVFNRVIDLGDEIVKDKKLGYPLEIKDIFRLLEENEIINKGMEDKLKEFVILRNRFAHKYGLIKKENILEMIRDMNVVRDFLNEIIEHIKEEEK